MSGPAFCPLFGKMIKWIVTVSVYVCVWVWVWTCVHASREIMTDWLLSSTRVYVPVSHLRQSEPCKTHCRFSLHPCRLIRKESTASWCICAFIPQDNYCSRSNTRYSHFYSRYIHWESYGRSTRYTDCKMCVIANMGTFSLRICLFNNYGRSLQEQCFV